MESMKGLTFMIVLGKFAKPKLYLGKGGCYGICLGWISIQIVMLDLECWNYNANKMISNLKQENEKFKLHYNSGMDDK